MTLQESLDRQFSLVYDTVEMNLAGMSAEQSLARPASASTRAGLLTLLAFHQTYHVGQLGVSRRVAGLPNAEVDARGGDRADRERPDERRGAGRSRASEGRWPVGRSLRPAEYCRRTRGPAAEARQ